MPECRSTNSEAGNTVAVAKRHFDSRRIYTVILLAPLLYGAIRFLPPLAFTCIVAVCGGLALYEFYRLCFHPSPKLTAIGVGLAGYLALVMSPHVPDWLQPSLVAALAAVLSIPLLTKTPLDECLVHGAVTLTGMLYLGLTSSYLVMTRMLPQGEWLIFYLVLVTWASDTGAYYIGTLCGRHALAPRLSPKKTWEGLAGGLVFAILVAYIARWWFLPDLSLPDCTIIAILLTATGFWGDLAESAIKRSVRAKDSGSLLPGHGGMLDRLDSLLFTAPAFYYYVTVVSRIGQHT